MQILHLKFVCRVKKKTYILFTPETVTENVLNRKFYADAPNEKWLTDVMEFKVYVGPEIRKLYLSAIFDLYDRRIAAYKIGLSTIIRWYLIHLMRRLPGTRVHTHCFIAIEDSNIQVKRSITN